MARVLLLISTLAALTCVTVGLSCSISAKGRTGGVPVYLTTVQVQSDKKILYTKASGTCAVIGTVPIGVEVSACSGRAGVSVSVPDLEHALVETSGAATVDVTVYCGAAHTGNTRALPLPTPEVISTSGHTLT